MLSIDELCQKVADGSKGNEDNHEQDQYSHLDDAASSRDTRRDGLFRHFYQVIQKERDRERSSDCVIISMDDKHREYATVIGHRLQDHGLVVEMIHLYSESDLSRALQEVKDEGSPFCILVEQSNVKLSSCTVIMFHESIKIHRHMPLENALVLVAKEYRRLFAKREQQQRARIALKAGDLVDDFLARESLASYTVPLDIQHLVFLLSEGRHLYRSELDLLIDYLKTRKEQLEGSEAPNPVVSSDHSLLQGGSPPVVTKPPPLLPNLSRRAILGPTPLFPARSPLGAQPGGGLLPTPGPVNTKGPYSQPLLPLSKRPALWGSLPPKPTKRPLLGEKLGLSAPPPALLQSVLPKQTAQPVSLLN